MKKLTAIAAIFIIGNGILFANTVSFQNAYCSGTITYNEKAKPGEAIWARLNMKIEKRRKNSAEPVAVIQLVKDDKKIDSAKFYHLNSKGKRQTNPEMLAGLPLSIWLDTAQNYSIKVIFSTGTEDTPKEAILPFTLENVEWEKEIIPLDEKNSEIRQDMSPERLAQIEKLNNILGTLMENDVYSIKPFIQPVKSNRYTAHFGDQRIYKYTNGKTAASPHYGNDYGVPEGTEVVACAEGRVVMAENRISTGWSVVIEHLPGLYSLYYHMKSLNVKENDYVKAGEKIGLSGSTGLATGPHLHWEVRLNMAALKPEFFMQDFTQSGQ
ncbi:MAG: M23 family metallopeptidase [Treponema sp.]|nr:M23 family metallopeptidase [Treponema sp.]